MNSFYGNSTGPQYTTETLTQPESLADLANGIETLMQIGVIDRDEARAILIDAGYLVDREDE